MHMCRTACTRVIQHAHVSSSMHTCRTACTRVAQHAHVSSSMHRCRAACTRFAQHAHVSSSVHTCRTACTRVVHDVGARTGDDESRRRGHAAAGAAGQAGTPQSRVRWRAWPIPPIAGSSWLGSASLALEHPSCACRHAAPTRAMWQQAGFPDRFIELMTACWDTGEYPSTAILMYFWET